MRRTDRNRSGTALQLLRQPGTRLPIGRDRQRPERRPLRRAVKGTADSFIQAYGPPPIGFEAPPLAPPSIEGQFAEAVTNTEAKLRAEINPHFFAGGLGPTNYYLQYGTEACIKAEGFGGACAAKKPAPPGAVLRAGIVDEVISSDPVTLSGLLPNTAYRYRFVAEGNGAPGVVIVGVGGKEGVEGTDAGFHTYADPPIPDQCPANEAFRGGASGFLPDCRAYEMVSPPDKEGGEIRVLGETTTGLPTVLEQSSTSGKSSPTAPTGPSVTPQRPPTPPNTSPPAKRGWAGQAAGSHRRRAPRTWCRSPSPTRNSNTSPMTCAKGGFGPSTEPVLAAGRYPATGTSTGGRTAGRNRAMKRSPR